jgi:hypothetical protein
MKISEKAISEIRARQMQVAAAQRSLQDYVNGLAQGMGVPEGYELDLKNGIWKAPEKEPGKHDKKEGGNDNPV